MSAPKHTPLSERAPARVLPTRKPVVWVGVLGMAVVALVSIGSGSAADTAAKLLGLIDTWLRAGWAPLVFLLASFGLGRTFEKLTSIPESRMEQRARGGAAVLQLTLGLALMLTLVHGLGVLGLLSPLTAIGLAAVGSAMAIHQGLKSDRISSHAVLSAPPISYLLVLPLAIGIVAVASPPGWLWGSEFGGYDALSYHLQLPQEWLRLGRVTPLEHNVYSFLPSYLESASVFLAHLTLAPIDGGTGHGLTAGTGWRAMMPQTLHLMITVCAAWAVGVFAMALAHDVLSKQTDSESDSEQRDRLAAFSGWTTAAITLATPWVLVTGTLAYNEMAVVLLGAGALLVATDRGGGMKPIARTMLCGFLVGVACGCKPTAILFVAPPVGIVLLAGLGRKNLLPAVGLGTLVGAVTLSPWLIRNGIAGGNPVFPAMPGVFGAGHYDSSAIARYADAHTFDGSVLDRLRLLVWTDPAAGAGAAAVQRFRGLANPQWMLLGPAGVGAMGLVCLSARTRRVGVMLSLGLLSQLVAWAVFTHLQSRFLLPCVLMLSPAVGVAAACGAARLNRGGVVVMLLVLAQTAASVWVFASQRQTNPNARVPLGPTLEIGRPYDPALGELIPSAYLNHELPAGSVVYLLGDATPFYFETPTVYNTAYDPWPLGEAIAADPGSPEAWTRTLKSRGITHVLFAPGELSRLTGSGWIDPAITPARVSAWFETLGSPTRVWGVRRDNSSRALYRLDHAEGSTP